MHYGKEYDGTWQLEVLKEIYDRCRLWDELKMVWTFGNKRWKKRFRPCLNRRRTEFFWSWSCTTVKSWELDMQESHLFLGHLTDYGYTSISSFGNSKAVPSGAGGGVRFESWLSQLPMNYTILGLVSSPLGGLLLCLFLYTSFGSLMEVVWRLFFYHKPISMICNMYVYASLLLYKKILLCLNPIVRPGCRWCFSIERKLSFFGGNRPLAVISKLACPQALGLFQQWTNTVQFVVEDSTSSTCEKKTKKKQNTGKVHTT